MQVLFLDRAPRTKETLPDFLKWRRVTRPPLVFRGLTGSQRTPGFWGVTLCFYPLYNNIFVCRAEFDGYCEGELINVCHFLCCFGHN